MAESMERLKRKRATIRTLTTKLLQRIEKGITEPETDINEIEECLSQLSVKETLLRDLDRDIEVAIQDYEELESEIQGAQEYQERIITWKCRAGRRMKGSQDAENRSSTAASDRGPSTVKLPRITLNKFHGDASEWQTFWSQFDSSINQSTALSKIDKFNYLKSYLGGTAVNAVSGLSLTDQNYDAAIVILTERFGRKDLVVNAHMNKLLNLSPVNKSSEVDALRKLFDVCEIQVRSLESLGVVSDTYGSLLCPILLKMIPEDIALEFNRRRTDNAEWKVRELLTFLQREIEGRERTLLLTKAKSDISDTTEGKPKTASHENQFSKWNKGPKWDKGARYRTPSAAALNTTMGFKCIFCEKSDHVSEDCQNRSLDERRDTIRKQGRCYVCLKPNHIARYCKMKIKSCSICGKRHNKSVCNQNKNSESFEDKEDTVISSVSQENGNTEIEKTVLLQTVGALAIGKDRNRNVRCLLDGGSQRTFIRRDVSKALNSHVVGEETLNIHTFGSNSPVNTKFRRVRVCLKNTFGVEQLEIEALETPSVCSAIIGIPGTEIRTEMNSRGFQLADGQSTELSISAEITVLIGADYYWKVVTGRVERLTESLVALETMFGWCVQGPTTILGITLASSSTSICKIVVDETELVSTQLRAFWELESLGITDKAPVRSNLEEEALLQFESKISFKNGRYEVGLPWRTDHDPLPDNFAVARRRFSNLVKRLKTNVSLYVDYASVINDQIEQGIVEVVNKEDIMSVKGYYMPHHAVIREDKTTTKIRVVFDASSHENGCPSLNDCLLPGPNLNPDLLTVLLKFRCHRIALMADIEKAFLQIALSKEDRDFVRFLWFEENLQSEEPKIVVLRMARVLFGVTSSPFLLSATIQHHVQKYTETHPEICALLMECLYVDDFISGGKTDKDAFRIAEQSKEILKQAGMNLVKWRTNSKELQSRIQETRETNVSIGGNELTPLKVLGLSWNPETDNFSFDLKSLLNYLITRRNTKRYVLQVSARVFDPIGFLAPFLIRVKCLFQILWEKGLEWDEDLPNDLKLIWDNWCLELPNLSNVTVPRYYFSKNTSDVGNIQLHGFCDASEKAYGAAFYVRYLNSSGAAEISFITAKTRVAPLKKVTLPRLELMGALIAARLASHLKRVFDIGDTFVYLWTDSTIVLHWIRGPSNQWKPFVSNRVVEITNQTDPQSWGHCRGQDNPADLLSRGCLVGEMHENSPWWTGPTWLVLPSHEWPNTTPESLTKEQTTMDLRKSFSSTQLNCNVAKQPEELLELKRYSSLRRVVRVTAWIQRIIHNLKNHNDRHTGPLTSEQLFKAESYWIKVAQQKEFNSEVERLKENKTVARDSRIAEYNPFLDNNGLIRVGGRLQLAGFSFAERHPWLLPPKHRLAELIVKSCHEQVMHSGLRDTTVQTRENYWILRGRQLTKSIIQKCFICKKFSTKSGMQVVAPLPRDRIQEAPPFETTGVDFAGPLYVRGKEKAYIVLFTCAVTRAVHLELTSDLSANNFMLALKRFFSRRGVCRVIYSDNAKTFKRANTDLTLLWTFLNSQELRDFYGERGISWKFIVPRAAWWGGFWERLVRSVKGALKKTLGRTSLTFEELQTKLTEVEAVLNSRPITFTYNDVGEPSPLTPAHFLIGKRLISLPPNMTTVRDISSTRDQLTKRLKYQDNLMNRLWMSWKKDYLLELKSANSSKPPNRIKEVKTNDVVILAEEKTPRLMWKIGRIVEVFQGRDNKVRSCTVRLPSGATLKRPIQLIYPLEVQDDSP